MKARLKNVDASKGKPNVLNLFVDTISRGRFFRVFPKTIEFLANMKNKKNAPSKVSDYSKFHSILGYTMANLVPSTYGIESEKWRDNIYDR